MPPTLHFLGKRIVIETQKGSISVNETIESNTDMPITKKPAGHVFQLPDCTIAHVTDIISKKAITDYACHVLILSAHKQHEELLIKLKPKLAILTHLPSYMNDPLNIARELKKKTGVQTITAHDGLTIDLKDYSALAEQKSLSKYS